MGRQFAVIARGDVGVLVALDERIRDAPSGGISTREYTSVRTCICATTVQMKTERRTEVPTAHAPARLSSDTQCPFSLAIHTHPVIRSEHHNCGISSNTTPKIMYSVFSIYELPNTAFLEPMCLELRRLGDTHAQ
ncbi:hypothetical protein DPSP01_004329 [Paraphaeosphaeria sporulosa]